MGSHGQIRRETREYNRRNPGETRKTGDTQRITEERQNTVEIL